MHHLHPISKASLALAAVLTVSIAMADPVTGTGNGIGPSRSDGNGNALGTTANDHCAPGDLSVLVGACLGYASGNDGIDALSLLAGSTSWQGINLATLVQYKDDSPLAGSSTPLFDARRSATDDSRGDIEFLQSLTGPLVLTLKGGNTWAAYYLANDVAAGSSLSFDIPGLQGSGLSHASIYVGTPPSPQRLIGSPPSSVPEPGSFALVLGALGLLGWSRRHRTRA